VKQLLSLTFIVLFSITLRAQNAEQTAKPNTDRPAAFRFGVYGDYSWNFHKTTANVYCCDAGCGEFGNGTGKGFAAGLLGELPVFGKFELYINAGVAQRGGSFADAINSKDTVLDPNTNKYNKLSVTNTYTASILEITSAVGLKFTPIKKFPIYVKGGFAINFPMTSTFTQTEHITTPQGVVYPQTGTTTKVDGSGAIINIKQTYGASAALGYPFFINAPNLGQIFFYGLCS